jgi:uncharacterized membrane protein YfcA
MVMGMKLKKKTLFTLLVLIRLLAGVRSGNAGVGGGVIMVSFTIWILEYFQHLTYE